MTGVEATAVRASEARHGGRFLTQKLHWAAPHHVLLRDGMPILDALTAIDGETMPLSSVTWAEHVAQMRAGGRDRTRVELLDQAMTWPVIRVALGFWPCCAESLAAYSAGCTCGWSHFDVPRRMHYLSPSEPGEGGYPCPVHAHEIPW